MMIVICPDSYKGHARNTDAARWLGEGVARLLPAADIQLAPMADGGEGTTATFAGTEITVPTVDSAGRLTEATYRLDGSTAYIDVAAATGLPAVADQPCAATGDTFGTGVLIADATTRGATTVVLALGGTATIDGGTGILAALGARPIDAAGLPVPKGGRHLPRIATIDTSALNIPAAALNWVLLADTTTPADRAASVFGAQKGATQREIPLLDAALHALGTTLEVDTSAAGTGAAGGVAVALTWLSRLVHHDDSHITLLPGAAVVAASLGLDERIAAADLVITGEGRLDAQSATGKVVGTVAELAARHATPLAIAVAQAENAPELPGDTTVHIMDPDPDPARQLRRAGEAIARSFLARAD